jgi:23S rRNA G2069 N7-methylase RlmK/C1962 C5-methylase RlmI
MSAAGRTATAIEEAGLPADHPTLAAQPEDRYLAVALLRLD